MYKYMHIRMYIYVYINLFMPTEKVDSYALVPVAIVSFLTLVSLRFSDFDLRVKNDKKKHTH